MVGKLCPKGEPLRDEHAFQKISRTCSSGQKALIYLFEYHHPQPRVGEEEFEKQCGD